jgi:hypothetical protein
MNELSTTNEVRRPWWAWRFSLRTFMLGITLLCFSLGLLLPLNEMRRRANAIQFIRSHNGTVKIGEELTHYWFRYWLDGELANRVTSIDFYEPKDAGEILSAIQPLLKEVEHLQLFSVIENNESLQSLSSAANLQDLGIGLDSDGKGLKYLPHEHLQKLDIRTTKEPIAGLRELANFPNLKTLRIRSPIHESAMEMIGRLTQLQELDLANEGSEGRGLSHLRNLQQLKTLQVRLSDYLLDEMDTFSQLKQLDQLYLHGLGFEADLNIDTNKPLLDQLEIVKIHNRLSPQALDVNFQAVGGIEGLKLLHVCGANIKQGDLLHLQKLKQLRELKLFGCWLTDTSIDEICTLKQVQHIVLSKNFLSDAGLERLQSELKERLEFQD